MTGDKDKFVKRFVTFGNDNSAKIIGKGTITPRDEATHVENVLLIENMKQKLLSVSEMCVQGHTLTFNSKECEIRRDGLVRLVAIVIRTPNNIYVLDRVKEEKCCMGKIDEVWLWHRRMGHVNFKNIAKVSKKHVVRNMPEITKPFDTS